MTEKTSKKEPPPKNWFIHEGCGGIFIFDKDALVPDERTCQKCKRRETYIPNSVIIIGKAGVPEDELNIFCTSLIKEFFKRPEADNTEKSLIILVTRDKSNPKILAATIKITDLEKYTSEKAEILIRSCCKGDSYQKIVLAVCRKPLPLPFFEDKKTKG